MNDDDPYAGTNDPYASDSDPYAGGNDSNTGGDGGEPLAIGEPLSEDAPAATTETDADGWWGLEMDAPAAAWKDASSTHLDNLLRVPSMDDDPDSPPWKEGYELNVRGFGGLVSNDRRRFTLVGRGGSFVNQIEGNRTVTAKYQGTRVRRFRTDTVAGTDRLTVKGDAAYTFKSRTLMMTGAITRHWSGPIMRLASMEGVVCGGAMTRLIAGHSLTMSGMMTGDVYGGVARTAGIRSYLAVLQYRAAANSAWAIGLWVRNTTFTIVPLTPSPQAATPAGGAAKKMGRLAKAARKIQKIFRSIAKNRTMMKISKGAKGVVKAGKMVCPVVDILLGIAMIPFALFGIAMLLKGLLSKNVIPPAGPPRVENRTSGVTVETFMTKQFT